MSDSERAVVKERINPKERLVVTHCNFLIIYLDDKVLIKFLSDRSSRFVTSVEHYLWP